MLSCTTVWSCIGLSTVGYGSTDCVQLCMAVQAVDCSTTGCIYVAVLLHTQWVKTLSIHWRSFHVGMLQLHPGISGVWVHLWILTASTAKIHMAIGPHTPDTICRCLLPCLHAYRHAHVIYNTDSHRRYSQTLHGHRPTHPRYQAGNHCVDAFSPVCMCTGMHMV